MANELYQVLELSTQATPEEIKRSYFRLVRKYSPEKDPERFKSIREAYETLSDAKARANYDSLQQHGEEISNLVNQAEQKMSEGEWKSAIPLFKRVLVLLPGANAARNKLGICFAREQDWDNALKVYRQLTEDNPDVAIYWSNYGGIIKEYAESLTDENPEKRGLYQQAREQFKKAIDLEPYNSEPYLEVSRTYADQGDYARALSWADRAIGADGKTDFQDFETLFYICIIHLRSNQVDKIQAVAQRIISLLPENDKDIRQYVAARFYNFALEITKIGFNNSNFELLKAARSFFNAAQTFDPDDDDTKKLKSRLDSLIQAYEKFDALKEDSQISPGFSMLAAFYLAYALNQEIEDSDKVFENIVDVIFSVHPTTIINSIRRIKYYYSPIYKLNESFFDRIEQVAQDNLSKSQQQPGLLESIGKFFGF